MRATTIPVTLFPSPHRWTPHGVRKQASWAQLLRTAEKPELWPGEPTLEASADRLPGLSMVLLQDDTRIVGAGGITDRGETEERVETVSGLLVDYVDEPLADESHLRRWWQGTRFLAWTSPWNHRPLGERPPGPRWHVLVPFSAPVPLAEARVAARWVVHSKRNAGHVHTSTTDLSRVVPVPAVVPGGYAWFAGEGEPLDLRRAQEDLERWEDQDRRSEAAQAVAGTTLSEAVAGFRDRLKQPGRRALLPWPGAVHTLPRDGASEAPSCPDLGELARTAGSLWPGRLAVLAGASGSGRSALALQLAESVAREGHPVLYASAGLPTDEVVARLLVLRSACGGPQVTACHTSILEGKGDVSAIDRAAEALVSALPHLFLWTPTTPERTDEALRTRALGVSRACEGKPPLVLVDPVEGFEDGHALADAYRELSAACRDLVRAGSLHPDWPGAAVVAVIGACSGAAGDLSTAARLSEEGSEPTGRARLREALALEAGGLASDASLLLLLGRDAVPESGVGQAVVVVAKNRHGHTGCVPLRFFGAAGIFEEAQPR